MKSFLFLLLLLLFCILGYSQNNGQYFENSVIRIQYIGYVNNYYLFEVTNKTECENYIKVDKEGNFQNYTVEGNSSITIRISAPSPDIVVNFKVKREGGPSCSSNPDNGWIELSSPSPLLGLKNIITILKTERVSTDAVRILFRVSKPAKMYKIKLSLDGINYKDVEIINNANNKLLYDVTVKY